MTAKRFALLLAAFTFAGCSSTSPQASPAGLRQQVVETERAFARTMATRDHAAFVSFLSEEAVFFSGPKPLHGAEAVAAWWRRYYEGPAAPFSWEPEEVEVLDSGTLASERPRSRPDGEPRRDVHLDLAAGKRTLAHRLRQGKRGLPEGALIRRAHGSRRPRLPECRHRPAGPRPRGPAARVRGLSTDAGRSETRPEHRPPPRTEPRDVLRAARHRPAGLAPGGRLPAGRRRHVAARERTAARRNRLGPRRGGAASRDSQHRRGTVFEDVLFANPVTGHFRYPRDGPAGTSIPRR